MSRVAFNKERGEWRVERGERREDKILEEKRREDKERTGEEKR